MLRSTLLAILFAFSNSTLAGDFSYNAFTLGYGQTDFDDIAADGDSIGAELSFEIGESFYAFVGLGIGELDDDFGNSADVDQWGAGLGYHTELSKTVDLVASVSYQYVDISAAGFGSVDDNGIGLGIGLRAAASENLEVNGGISYVDFGDGGDDTSIGAGFLYSFTDTFAAGLSGNWGDDASSYSAGIRFYFGN